VKPSLLGQWEEELCKHTNENVLSLGDYNAYRVSVFKYYDANRKGMAHDLHRYDIVLTTYSSLCVEYRNKSAHSDKPSPKAQNNSDDDDLEQMGERR
jgi:hypothetical protein